ncbi:pyrroline-5-carboxylate reductase family protein [Sodalinema gerasimenkoae]|uniref:pyrroline-5-carboxylate reductase family protein n=1 Tax=Sodalinema gerasimenkoae TaxID=2862348 RepID=UPI003CCE1CFB
MAEAILSRLLAQQVYRPEAVSVGEPNPQRREYLAKTYQVQVSDDNASIAAEAQTLLLAIKPQIFAAVSGQLPPGTLSPQTLVISILAGTPLSKLEAAFPGSPVVRVMPNTPATVGAGISAVSRFPCGAGDAQYPRHRRRGNFCLESRPRGDGREISGGS